MYKRKVVLCPFCSNKEGVVKDGKRKLKNKTKQIYYCCFCKKHFFDKDKQKIINKICPFCKASLKIHIPSQRRKIVFVCNECKKSFLIYIKKKTKLTLENLFVYDIVGNINIVPIDKNIKEQRFFSSDNPGKLCKNMFKKVLKNIKHDFSVGDLLCGIIDFEHNESRKKYFVGVTKIHYSSFFKTYNNKTATNNFFLCWLIRTLTKNKNIDYYLNKLKKNAGNVMLRKYKNTNQKI